MSTNPVLHVGDRYVAVRYIGKKPKRNDNVLGRKISWDGPGSIQWVPERDAVVYITYPDIWALAPDVEVPVGGIFGLSNVAHAPAGPATDLKSTNALPGGLNRAPDPEFPSDAKAEGLVGEIKKMLDDEKLSIEAARQRIDQLIAIIPKLKKDDFGPDGKPKCAAFTRELKRVVLSAERDAAWTMVRNAMAKMARAGQEGEQAEETPDEASDQEAGASSPAEDPAALVP